jgi:uncharacterized protein YnzC (UPF0291/DUF896 family)
MRDVVVVTSTKTGEREKYITKKGANVARASWIAKKVTYDALIAKAHELRAIVSQKVKENVNVVVRTCKKTYKATTHNSKATLDVAMEITTKIELVLKQALTTIKTVDELGKNMTKLKLKMMKCKAKESSFNVATKQTKNEAKAISK